MANPPAIEGRIGQRGKPNKLAIPISVHGGGIANGTRGKGQQPETVFHIPSQKKKNNGPEMKLRKSSMLESSRKGGAVISVLIMVIKSDGNHGKQNRYANSHAACQISLRFTRPALLDY